MPVLLLLVVVGAAPLKSLALPDFTVVNVDVDVARLCSERLATELSQRGLNVVTSKQIATTLGLERQKELLGCSEGSASCLAELAGALGTDGIVMGDLGRVGSKLQLNVRVTRAASADTVATWLGVVDQEEDLLDEVSRAARGLAEKLNDVSRPARAHPFPVVPAVAGGVALVAGGVLSALAASSHAQLSAPATPITSPTEADRLRDEGKGFMIGSYIAYGLGVAAVGVGALLWLRGEPLPVTPSVAVQSGGAVIGVQGVLP